jgi:hypothetical protein
MAAEELHNFYLLPKICRMKTMRFERLFLLDIKRPGSEAHHPRPTSAEVKKTWVYTATPHCIYGVVIN